VRGRAGRSERIGAVVVGGDYQGLGIVRSLGSRGVPVCIIDDERSIARFSRYATYSLAYEDLRDERRTVDSVLDTGRRLGLDGWVLYPTRDETVAAFARHRSELRERFRVPTPAWDAVRRAWDKRETYALAAELGIPVPRTWYPSNASELAAIDGSPPFAIKPAIKEHFVYATKSKAWKAQTTGELHSLFDAAAQIVEPGEVMIQELIPGGGEQQFAYCAFFKNQEPVAKMVVQRTRQHPPEFGRASTFVQTVDLPALETLSERFLGAIDYYGLVELEFKLDPRDGREPGSIFLTSCTPIRPANRSRASVPRPAYGGCASLPICPPPRSSSRTAALTGAATAGRCAAPMSNRCSAGRIRFPGSWSASCSRTSRPNAASDLARRWCPKADCITNGSSTKPRLLSLRRLG
jgi:D-aspartate ligase